MNKHFARRTRFGEVVAEFMPPARPSRRVVIFAPGMPSGPSKGSLLSFFSQKGFWCFALRYRGTWESGGKFLKMSPEKDVLAVMNGLPRGFRDAKTDKVHRLKPSALYLFGSSFGGPAALLLSRDPRVTKVVALSPVVDWRVPSKTESPARLERFLRFGFGEAYRFSRGDWKKLGKKGFYNPVDATQKIDGKKIMIVHAKDDDTVSFAPVEKFAKRSGARLVARKRGGHATSSFITRPAIWKKIKNFLAA